MAYYTILCCTILYYILHYDNNMLHVYIIQNKIGDSFLDCGASSSYVCLFVCLYVCG